MPFPGAKLGGSHVIEKHERPDHAALRGRQDAANVELAEAAHARLDRQLDERSRLELQAFFFDAHGKA